MLLDNISSPADLKNLSFDQLVSLAGEIREGLFNRLTKKGGHFGPNFGFVEATIALHFVFDSPKDKIVFDVSHQCYPHKMLTGRAYGFFDETQFSKISGYSNPDESEHDFFKVGHTSTAVSLACGLAKARDLKGQNENIIAVLGDGSLSGGEALEALDFAGEQNSNFIVVLNDNDMSIAENHGGIYKNLKELRESNGKCASNIFKSFGLDYIYVDKGNDIPSLIEAFQKVKNIDHPIVVHINTLKGCGYKPAEENKELWHWTAPFNRQTAERPVSNAENYNSMTAEFLLKKMAADSTVAFVCPAVPANFGFTKQNREKAGKQFIDTGIAEEHAIALVSAMAKNGTKPVFGTHSSFIQRTYDQLSQDLCINKNPATLLVNTASVWGMNNITHLGIFDIPLMSNIPELVYLAPTNCEEYFAMLDWSIEQNKFPVAIRMPCNGIIHTTEPVQKDYSDLNKYKITQNGSKIAILALGDFFQLGEKTADYIEQQSGQKPTLINPRYITGLDKELLTELKKTHEKIITLEDGILDGGFGQKIASFYGSSPVKVYNFGLKKEFLDRYNAHEVLKNNHLTPEQIWQDIKN